MELGSRASGVLGLRVYVGLNIWFRAPAGATRRRPLAQNCIRSGMYLTIVLLKWDGGNLSLPWTLSPSVAASRTVTSGSLA